jgi:spore germination protein KB
VESGKISASQLMILTTLFTVGSAVLIVTSGLAEYAKQDAWLAALIGNGIGLLLVWLYMNIVKRLPDKNLLEMVEIIFGKWFGKIIGLYLLVTLFFGGPATVLYYLGDFMRTQILNETPIEAIHLLFGAIVIMGMRLGLETIARTAELLFPWFLFFFVVLTCLSLPNINIEHVQPVMTEGLKPVFSATLLYISVTFLIDIIFLMFGPVYIRDKQNTGKALLAGVMIGGFMMFTIVALSLLVLGPDLTAGNLYPTYVLAKKINIGNFIQRLEAVIAIVWFISLYFRVTIYMYAIMLGIRQIFNLKNVRPLALPLGMILIASSFIVYPNFGYRQIWDKETWVPYTLSLGILLPLLMLAGCLIRKKGTINN